MFTNVCYAELQTPTLDGVVDDIFEVNMAAMLLSVIIKGS
jgi:hypothetical protein